MWTFKKFGLMFDNLPCLSENKDFNAIYFTKYKRKIFLHSPPLRHFSILLFFPLKWLITSHVGSLGHRANVHHDLLKTQIETYHKSKWCSSFFCCDSIVFAINKIRRRKENILVITEMILTWSKGGCEIGSSGVVIEPNFL